LQKEETAPTVIVMTRRWKWNLHSRI